MTTISSAAPVHATRAAHAPGTLSAIDEDTNAMMRAVVATGYGTTDVLELTDRKRPTPGDREVLIQVHATSVTAADSMMRRGDPAYARLFLGLLKPNNPVPGTGLAGVVQAVGSDVVGFAVGDEVFGEAGVSFGAHAEFVAVAADGVLVHKPEALSFEDAATICDGPLTSFNFLKRMANLQPGQTVLINGASGSLGTAAVQLAKVFGAEVTGVCSGANVEMVRSLGADQVIDYTLEDFTRSGRRYDVIYDTVGKSSFGRCKQALTAKGKYLSPVLSIGLLFSMLWTAIVSGKRAMFDATGLRPAPELRGFLAELKEMLANEKLGVVMERVYRLEQVAEAHEHVDGGHKKGNVVMRLTV